MSSPVSRRDFLSTSAQTATLAAVGIIPNTVDVRDFNAVGDGKTDNTVAIQKALDKAAKTKGTVFIPDGVFLCSKLKIPPFVGLSGNPTWGYTEYAGSVLRLGDKSASCLLDVTGAFGFRLKGVCLDGAGLGTGVHGILLDKPDYGQHEDTICIERCRIGNFTGDGLHLSRIWVFTIRHSMIGFNQANGLWYRGWDGFILDNWFSGNGEAGIGAYEEHASVTITGNRIEWNKRYGIVLKGGQHYNITGNYFDRTSGPALALLPRGNPEDGKRKGSRIISVTGNVIYRSGAPHGGPFSDKYQSVHLRLEEASGVSCVGNTFNAGRDDGGKGEYSPNYGLVVRALSKCVVKDNVMHEGAMQELVVDQGAHGEGVILKDNVGSILTPNL